MLVVYFVCILNSSYAKEIVLTPDGSKDFTPIVLKIINEHEKGDFVLKFAKGVYHFYPEKAFGKYLEVSNNDNSFKYIAFPLINKSNVRIEGDNAEFLMHGTIVPFLMENCKAITVSGIQIDYDYSFIFEGEVIASNEKEKSIDLKISKNNLFKVVDGVFYFEGYNWKSTLGENIVFDKKTKRPYYNTAKYLQHHWKKNSILKAKKLTENSVRLAGFNSESLPPVGSIYVDKGLVGFNRLYPGFVIHHSSQVNINNATVFMSGAMALIAENSIDISLTKFDVKLREGSSRIISSSADATHFVGCRGKISFSQCSFSNMLDDATNVHGTYLSVKERLSDYTLGLAYGHFQQKGFDFAKPGEKIVLVNRKTLIPFFSTTVKQTKRISDQYLVLETEDQLPAIIPTETAIENEAANAAVTMSNCRVEGNRARSILISTSAPVLIENNYFSSMMAGILIAGDANKWWECGSVKDVVIRKNTFENIGIGGNAPQSVLQISPEIHQRVKGAYYHGKIVFEDNIIHTFDAQVIYGLSVQDIVIKNNKFKLSKDYLPIYKGLSYFDLQNCKTVTITGNQYIGDKLPANVSITNVEKITYEHNEGFLKGVVNKPNTFFYQQ